MWRLQEKKTFHRIEILTGTLTSSDNWFFPESGDYNRIQSLGKNSSEASRWLYFETRFVVVVFFKGFFSGNYNLKLVADKFKTPISSFFLFFLEKSDTLEL